MVVETWKFQNILSIQGSGHDSKIGNQSVAKVIIIERKWSFSPFIFLQLVKPQSGIEKKKLKNCVIIRRKIWLKDSSNINILA